MSLEQPQNKSLNKIKQRVRNQGVILEEIESNQFRITISDDKMKNFLQNAHPLNVKFDDDFVKYYSKPYQEHELILSIDHDNAKLILTYANHQFEYFGVKLYFPFE